MQLPGGLETIDYTNLYSEAAALNCAYIAIMKECNVPLNETTMGRRAGTVRRWIQWIWEQIAD